MSTCPRLIALLLPSLVLAGQMPPNVTQIAEGVWFLQDEMCNVTFIEMKRYLIVIDAGFPDVARKAVAVAKMLSPKPVKYVFDTHHHGDHLYGNPVWTETGATTMAHAGVLDELARYEPLEFQFASKRFSDVAALNRTGPEPPQKTFSGSIMLLRDSFRRVEFRHYGWSHSRGDGIVYLPKEKIMCTGDVVVNGAYIYMSDANIANWPKVIVEMEELPITHVLPGHGPAGGKELLAGQRQYLTELYAQVSEAVMQGRKPADVHFSDRVQNWVAKPRLYRDIRDCYNEIVAGKPAGSLPHNGPTPR